MRVVALALVGLALMSCGYKYREHGRACLKKVSPKLRAIKASGPVRAFVRFEKRALNLLKKRVKVLWVRGTVALVEAPPKVLLELACEPWVVFVEEVKTYRHQHRRGRGW
ncbi:MAG: hypothetical protein GXO03_05875 [Aquificae bacterium]|nr:hypothetical protein [Aquificota bacterium]